METSKPLNPLTIRVLSSSVAVALIIALYVFLKTDGGRILVLMVPILGTRELHRIIFKSQTSRFLGFLFAACVFSVFLSVAFWPASFPIVLGVCFAVFNAATLFYESRYQDLQTLNFYQSKALAGMLYVGLLPGLAFQILSLPNGLTWFLGLLGIVFSGDTFAYLTGVRWGKSKLLPNVSPKKTWEGAIGGLGGSTLAAITLWTFMPEKPLWALVCLAIATGITAQLGDLYESMLKRNADVKDSGKIMPGHGGLLDRIDGVLFAAPIILLGASLLEKVL